MAEKNLLAAVQDETGRFLANQHGLWTALYNRAAEELGPLLADLIRQQLLHQLGQPTPDVRLERMKLAAQRAFEWFQENKDSELSWADYPEEVFSQLRNAAECLPSEQPPRLTLPEPERRHLLGAIPTLTLAFNVLSDLNAADPPLHPQAGRAVEQLATLLKEVLCA